MENVITLGKLIVLLFLFCLPLLSIFFVENSENKLARPVMGTIFLVIIGAGKGGQGSNTPLIHLTINSPISSHAFHNSLITHKGPTQNYN